jgi:hypothetical protein
MTAIDSSKMLLLAALVGAAGCAGDDTGFSRVDALDVPEEERVAAIMGAFMQGPSDMRAMRMPSLDGLMLNQAHADVADYDYCSEPATFVLATTSKRGPSESYGSAASRVTLDANASYCQDAAGNSLQNTANTQYKTWTASGMLLECSWGQDYNLTGSGVIRKPTDETMEFYGTYSVGGGPGAGEWDCSIDASEGSSDGVDDISAMSCTNAAGETWTELQVLAATASQSCTLSFGSTNVDPPTADCGADGSGYALDTVSFDGSGSTDPYGRPLSYSWGVTSAPMGSAAEFADSSAAAAELMMDLVGTYTATLTVTTVEGTTDSCEQTWDATSYEDLRVEMWWDETDDMDLHMLRPDSQGGATVFDRPGDAGWFNPNPDWGVAGETSDDPALDLDDIWAVGPENINIAQPASAPLDGWYTIYVHDYPSTVERQTPNGVHVRIYLDNVVIKEYDFNIEGEDAFWYVARIHWPSGALENCDGLAGCS